MATETVTWEMNWTNTLPMLLVQLLHGFERKDRDAARAELEKMAKLADAYAKQFTPNGGNA